ncbi:hypothetical protein COW53_04760 [bacterium CG17_big_fil_post_rev_8_21_14_2_50_64_8]|nr:MAG: hypothetical protein COW53_04760 [bacterium CG17_big_fil_post_rev_8_21_14_2_50_64_8]
MANESKAIGAGVQPVSAVVIARLIAPNRGATGNGPAGSSNKLPGVLRGNRTRADNSTCGCSTKMRTVSGKRRRGSFSPSLRFRSPSAKARRRYGPEGTANQSNLKRPYWSQRTRRRMSCLSQATVSGGTGYNCTMAPARTVSAMARAPEMLPSGISPPVAMGKLRSIWPETLWASFIEAATSTTTTVSGGNACSS